MQRCDGFWGEYTLKTEPLRTVLIQNAIYMPASTQVYLDNDPLWGIYTENGDLVAQSAYERQPHRELVGQSRRLDLAGVNIVDGPFEEMVYAGPLISHYGHFLLASLARLWAVDGSHPTLFHSHPPIFDHGAPYIVELIAAAKLSPSNAFSFDRPTRLQRLIVPEASLVEQVYTSHEYITAVARVGQNILETGRFKQRDYYISKSRLRGGVACLVDEEVIERAFIEAGFEIVYPETLSLPDQVSLFRNARTIAGTASSAFHTLALTPESTGRRILFDYASTPNANFALLDHGSKSQAFYYSLADRVRRERNEKFLSSYIANDIDTLAAEMVRIASPKTIIP